MVEIIIKKILEIDYISLIGKILLSLFILVIGLWLIKMVIKTLKTIMIRRDIDPSLRSFLISIVGWGLRFLLFITVAGELGIKTTSFAAAIGAAGLAIGMALQGSLSNFAGGAMILIFKPFRVGDFINAQGQQGTVKKIEIFTTTLNTTDNKEIIIPNGVLSNGIIVNYSSENMRRVDLTFGVSYNSDIKKTKDILLEVVNNNPLVLDEPKPVILLMELNKSSIDFSLRSWVMTSDYWAAYSDILEKGKEALDKAGIEIPYPHVVEIHKQG